MKTEKELKNFLKNKKVLYIATKNKDYIRINQEIELFKELCNTVDIISYSDKNYLIRLIKCFWRLLFTNVNQYDLIFVGFMAQMIIPFWHWKWRNQLVVTDFFISIFDTLVDDRKFLKDGTMPAKVVKLFDEITIKKSDYIVADTKSHAKYFIQELGAKEDKCFVLYLNADNTIYFPRVSQKPKELEDKYVVLYFGSILPLQGVEYVLEVIERLKDEKKIHFIMVGPIGKKYKKVESDTVTYIDWLTQEELSEYISMSDLCLGGHFNPNIGKANRTIPGKVYIYKNMGKRVILGDSLANSELYEEDEDTFFVEMGRSDKLAQCIIKCFQESEEKNESKFHRTSI